MFESEESFIESGESAGRALLDHYRQRNQNCTEKLGGENGTMKYLGTMSTAHDISSLSKALDHEMKQLHGERYTKDMEGLSIWAASYSGRVAYGTMVAHQDVVRGLVLECKCCRAHNLSDSNSNSF